MLKSCDSSLAALARAPLTASLPLASSADTLDAASAVAGPQVSADQQRAKRIAQHSPGSFL